MNPDLIINQLGAKIANLEIQFAIANARVQELEAANAEMEEAVAADGEELFAEEEEVDG